MPKNDTSEILLIDQPGKDKLCRIRTLLDAVSKVKFTTTGLRHREHSAYERTKAFKGRLTSSISGETGKIWN